MAGMKTVCVIGIWHLGAVNAVGFAEMFYNVIGIELDPAKAESLQKGIPPIQEPKLDELLNNLIRCRVLSFTSDMSAVKEADAVVIAYDTPLNDNDEADIFPIVSSAMKAAPYLKPDTPLVITSQVPVGTCETIELQVQAANPQWKSGVVYCPENLRLGSAISNFLHPDMLIIGARKDVQEAALALYKPFKTTKKLMDLRSAEMVKHALNTFLATEITFINEIANLSDRLGVDAVAVGEALKLDKRIGSSALLNPGLGFAGGTLARDVNQLNKFAKQFNYSSKLLESIIHINEQTFDDVVSTAKSKLGSLEGKNVGFLGLTYKPDTSTVRRSPAIKLAKKFNLAGAKCFGYDPLADANELKEYKDIIDRKSSVLELAKDMDILILVTCWKEFIIATDFEAVAKLMRNPIIIDTRNFLPSDTMINMGFDYKGFGRPNKKG